MASRRRLKLTIQFVTSELINDIYFRCLLSKELDTEKVESMVMNIETLKREFLARASRPDAKNNPALVKAYFRKLFADWQLAMEKVIKEIEKL